MNRLLILTAIISPLTFKYSTAVATMALRSVDFEVFGRVQGVFFRKVPVPNHSVILKEMWNPQTIICLQYTKEQADKLSLKGWCRNTSHGTVEGQMQGPSDKIQEMIHWLKTTGSPSSKIDKADFKNDKEISKLTFSNFDIRRDN